MVSSAPRALPAVLRAAERRALAALTQWLRDRFGTRLREVHLFGSRARGQGNEDSDLDVLVVVEALTSPEWREIAHQGGDLLTDHGVLVAPLAFSAAQWDLLRARERRIVAEIDRDGIPL